MQLNCLLARRGGYEGILIDGPPGLGCPVISTMADADTIMLVTEPGVAGLYDLQRILEVIEGIVVIRGFLCIILIGIAVYFSSQPVMVQKPAGSMNSTYHPQNHFTGAQKSLKGFFHYFIDALTQPRIECMIKS